MCFMCMRALFWFFLFFFFFLLSLSRARSPPPLSAAYTDVFAHSVYMNDPTLNLLTRWARNDAALRAVVLIIAP